MLFLLPILPERVLCIALKQIFMLFFFLNADAHALADPCVLIRKAERKSGLIPVV